MDQGPKQAIVDPPHEPIASGVQAATFRVIFTRPTRAIPVDKEARIQQLRGVFEDATKVTSRYILADVIDCKNGREAFCITFNTNPSHPMAHDAIKSVIDSLTPEKIKAIVADGTGLDPRRISVEEKQT